MSDMGETRPAGAGLSDDEMAEQVAAQTGSDLKHEQFFQREAAGATSDVAAAKEDADDVTGEQRS